MTCYVIANWKMHGSTVKNTQFFEAFDTNIQKDLKVGICAPAPYWFQLREAYRETQIAWGGQDVSEHLEGAYTGEVSVGMLEDFECRYVIIGHSERRQYHGESSDMVARKLDRIMQSSANNLVPIVCIGEQLDERQSGQVEIVLSQQLAPVLSILKSYLRREVLLAYEPVWAIGTGVVAEPEAVRETHTWIANHVYGYLNRALPILYGGSVKAENAGGLVQLPHVGGFLVGGASLKASTFRSLLECCQSARGEAAKF